MSKQNFKEKEHFKLNKFILLFTLISSLLAYGQESFKFKNISNYSIHTLKESEVIVPDYETEYRRPMYNGKYNKEVLYFIESFEKIFKQLKGADNLDKKQRRKKRKELHEERKRILIKFNPIFNELKRKDMRMTHFRGVEFTSSNLLENTKKELIKLNGEIVNLEYINERELLTKVPTKKIKLKYLIPVSFYSKIQGDYIVGGEIKVSTKNSVKDKLYEKEVIEKDISSDNYSTYTYFKSVDGSGANFYSNSIDIYDEYTVTRKTKPLTAKQTNIIRKVKLYLKQADPLLKKMYNGILAHKNWTLTKQKRTSFTNATKQVKLIDRQIRALYNNDLNKYYDFQKLLGIKTIKNLTYFDTVLSNSKRILGLN